MNVQFQKDIGRGGVWYALPSRGENQSVLEEIKSYLAVEPVLVEGHVGQRVDSFIVIPVRIRSLQKHTWKQSVSWEIAVRRMENHIDTVHRGVKSSHVRMGETSQGDRNPYSRVEWMGEHSWDQMKDRVR